MITIGFGKQKGADAAHVLGFKYMAEFSVEMAKVKLPSFPSCSASEAWKTPMTG
jgi:hypothetical protein